MENQLNGSCDLKKEFMMKKIPIFVILILILLAGCGGPYYFDLHLEPDGREGRVKIDKILFIEDLNSSEAYWRQSIVFRKAPYLMEYYLFKQWAKSPGELIKDAVILFYKNSYTFKKVIKGYTSIDPDISMRIYIYSLEMVKSGKGWYAHLALDLEFVDKRTEKVLTTHSFDRKEKIKGKKARYLPEKISMILREELVKAADKLALKF